LAVLKVLAEVRAHGEGLVRILLVGEERLAARLQVGDLHEFHPLIKASVRLQSLAPDHLGPYIFHRLSAAGCTGVPRLRSSVLPLIEAACEGIPARINQLCSRLLLHGAIERKSVLDEEDVAVVFAELREERLGALNLQIP
jgi:type II secretory pathway predicted ATPase ExeA